MEAQISSRDAFFLESLNRFIDEELSYLNPDELSKERYLIFQQAFNEILDYVQAYKNLLAGVKKEYEICIDALERGELEASNIKNDLNKAVTHTTTIYNLKRRNDELKIKAAALNESNRNLQETLERLLKHNEKHRPKKPLFEGNYSFLNLEKPKVAEEKKNTKGEELIPGLDIEQATDLEYLSGILQKIEYKIRELSTAQTQKYSAKARKLELQRILGEKVITRDNMQIKTDSLKQKLYLYKLAISAAKEYYEGGSQHSSIQEALTKAIINGSVVKQLKVDDDNEQTEESSMENEAEYILDYIEKFNELFENGKYKEAAYFAAASPRHVLRTIETLYRFKSVCDIELGINDPMMLYCCAILDSINESVPKPDAIMSLEFFKISLGHNKFDVLTRWVSQRKLTFSYDAAKAIEDFIERSAKYTKKGLELALFIYRDIDAFLQAAICMIKLGRIKAAIHYIKSHSEKFKPNAAFYLQLLHKCPELEFANALLDESISVEQIVSVLLDSEQPHNGLKFIKLQIDNMSKEFTDDLDEKVKEEFKAKKQKLKTSYDTLCKFSFLTMTNEDQFTKSVAAESRDQVQQLYSRLGGTAGSNSNSNCENSLSLSNKTEISEEKVEEPMGVEKSVRFEKVETWSINEMNQSELLTTMTLEQASVIAEEASDGFSYEQINSTSIEIRESATSATTGGSTSTRPLHNDFYNKFNEEIFDDDEDLS